MKSGKNLLPVVLIGGGVIIGLFTVQHHGRQQTINPLQVIKNSVNTKDKSASNVNHINALANSTLINYQCDGQKIIQAQYDQAPSIAPSQKVTLVIDGQRQELAIVPSPTGSLYTNLPGNSVAAQTNQGIRWHVQGLEARLLTVMPDPMTHMDKEALVLRCQQPV